MIERFEERARKADEGRKHFTCVPLCSAGKEAGVDAAIFYRDVLEEVLTLAASPLQVEALVRSALCRAGAPDT